MSDISSITEMSIDVIESSLKQNTDTMKNTLINFPSNTALFQLQFVNSQIEEKIRNNEEKIDDDIYISFFNIIFQLLGIPMQKDKENVIKTYDNLRRQYNMDGISKNI